MPVLEMTLQVIIYFISTITTIEKENKEFQLRVTIINLFNS